MADAVAEIETSWAKQLGGKRFAELRQVLRDVSQLPELVADRPYR